MASPRVIGHIEPRSDGGRVVIKAWCVVCKAYRTLTNVRPWPGLGEHYGECQCGNSTFGQPEGGDAA